MMPTDEVLQDNASVIDEYRAHGGEVAGLGFPVLLLTTTGTRSGRRTTVPLGFKVDAGQVFVVASNGGAPRHPGWFHNLVANPAVIVELGDQAYEGRAVVAQMESAILNLVTHACDVMPQGGQLLIDTARVDLPHAANAEPYVLLAIAYSAVEPEIERLFAGESE